MKLLIARIVPVLVLVGGVTIAKAQEQAPTTKKNPAAPADQAEPTKVTPLTDEQINKLLAQRLDGGASGLPFSSFANMFFVTSSLNLGRTVGLMTEEKEIADAELTSTFPAFYRPTLRELLDAIALQTSSEWKSETTGKFVRDETNTGKPVIGVAIFEFKKTNRKKPYQVKLGEGWKVVDHGNWVKHVPPVFPVGMDIYELGTFTTDDADKAKFLRELPYDVSLDWARKVNQQAKLDDLKTAKVGPFDAVYYEAMIPSQAGKDIRWRQWVFVAGDRCYFVVSTIFPDFEDQIFPDVQAMLKTFELRK